MRFDRHDLIFHFRHTSFFFVFFDGWGEVRWGLGGVGCQNLVDLLGKIEVFTDQLRSEKFYGK